MYRASIGGAPRARSAPSPRFLTGRGLAARGEPCGAEEHRWSRTAPAPRQLIAETKLWFAPSGSSLGRQTFAMKHGSYIEEHCNCIEKKLIVNCGLSTLASLGASVAWRDHALSGWVSRFALLELGFPRYLKKYAHLWYKFYTVILRNQAVERNPRLDSVSAMPLTTNLASQRSRRVRRGLFCVTQQLKHSLNSMMLKVDV